ncbi:hypothetical protein Tco_1051472 [Tanacetum coccineum]
MTDYHVEYGVPFTLLHCWDVLKECDRWNSEKVPLFMQKREEAKNKRYKLSGSSSFNTKESREGSINSNTTVGNEEENKVDVAKNDGQRELELKATELEIRRMENRQRDEALYETTIDEELKARLSQMLFG